MHHCECFADDRTLERISKILKAHAGICFSYGTHALKERHELFQFLKTELIHRLVGRNREHFTDLYGVNKLFDILLVLRRYLEHLFPCSFKIAPESNSLSVCGI